MKHAALPYRTTLSEHNAHANALLQDTLGLTDRIRILEERLHLLSPKEGHAIAEAPTAAAEKAKK